MAKQSIVAPIQDDLCNWEFVNFSDESDDDESSYEVESLDLVESIDSLSSSSDVEEINDHHDDVEDGEEKAKEGPTRDDVNVGDDDDEVVACSRVSNHLGQNHVIIDQLRNLVNDHHIYDGGFAYNSGHHDDEEEEDDDDHDDDDHDGYDMDDELVPWEVKDKFVRQRIRKTGKVSIVGRNARSKKSALVFTRPGCVRGKHGLGLKVY